MSAVCVLSSCLVCPDRLARRECAPQQRRVRLRDGQQITGVFLGLEKDKLLFRTAWADHSLAIKPIATMPRALRERAA